MAITQAMCTSFKAELLLGVHDFRPSADTGADTFKLALYTSSASIDANTTAYTTSNEVTGTNYTAGGNTLTVSQVPTSTSTTAWLDFADTTWSSASITARGALIYKVGANGAVCVLDFGSDKTSALTFTVQMPEDTVSSALIRLV